MHAAPFGKKSLTTPGFLGGIVFPVKNWSRTDFETMAVGHDRVGGEVNVKAKSDFT